MMMSSTPANREVVKLYQPHQTILAGPVDLRWDLVHHSALLTLPKEAAYIQICVDTLSGRHILSASPWKTETLYNPWHAYNIPNEALRETLREHHKHLVYLTHKDCRKWGEANRKLWDREIACSPYAVYKNQAELHNPPRDYLTYYQLERKPYLDFGEHTLRKDPAFFKAAAHEGPNTENPRVQDWRYSCKFGGTRLRRDTRRMSHELMRDKRRAQIFDANVLDIGGVSYDSPVMPRRRRPIREADTQRRSTRSSEGAAQHHGPSRRSRSAPNSNRFKPYNTNRESTRLQRQNPVRRGDISPLRLDSSPKRSGVDKPARGNTRKSTPPPPYSACCPSSPVGATSLPIKSENFNIDETVEDISRLVIANPDVKPEKLEADAPMFLSMAPAGWPKEDYEEDLIEAGLLSNEEEEGPAIPSNSDTDSIAPQVASPAKDIADLECPDPNDRDIFNNDRDISDSVHADSKSAREKAHKESVELLMERALQIHDEELCRFLESKHPIAYKKIQQLAQLSPGNFDADAALEDQHIIALLNELRSMNNKLTVIKKLNKDTNEWETVPIGSPEYMTLMPVVQEAMDKSASDKSTTTDKQARITRGNLDLSLTMNHLYLPAETLQATQTAEATPLLQEARRNPVYASESDTDDVSSTRTGSTFISHHLERRGQVAQQVSDEPSSTSDLACAPLHTSDALTSTPLSSSNPTLDGDVKPEDAMDSSTEDLSDSTLCARSPQPLGEEEDDSGCVAAEKDSAPELPKDEDDDKLAPSDDSDDKVKINIGSIQSPAYDNGTRNQPVIPPPGYSLMPIPESYEFTLCNFCGRLHTRPVNEKLNPEEMWCLICKGFHLVAHVCNPTEPLLPKNYCPFPDVSKNVNDPVLLCKVCSTHHRLSYCCAAYQISSAFFTPERLLEAKRQQKRTDVLIEIPDKTGNNALFPARCYTVNVPEDFNADAFTPSLQSDNTQRGTTFKHPLPQGDDDAMAKVKRFRPNAPYYRPRRLSLARCAGKQRAALRRQDSAPWTPVSEVAKPITAKEEELETLIE